MVQRRRKRRIVESAGSALLVTKVERGVRREQIADADQSTEGGQVGAAAHADMLAVVEDLARGGVGE